MLQQLKKMSWDEFFEALGRNETIISDSYVHQEDIIKNINMVKDTLHKYMPNIDIFSFDSNGEVGFVFDIPEENENPWEEHATKLVLPLYNIVSETMHDDILSFKSAYQEVVDKNQFMRYTSNALKLRIGFEVFTADGVFKHMISLSTYLKVKNK